MTDLTEQEIWKSISEFENQYEVSNLGRFRSIDRTIIRKGSQAKIKGKILKGQQDAYGYVTMTIKNKQVKAHRLVAKYFVENPLNKSQVNHKNGIKSDNRAVNLEWCSHEENMKHLYLTMPFEHKNSKQKRMEREDLIRKLTQFVESKTIEDVKNSWVSAKNILDVLCVKYNKIDIPMFYDEWKAKLEENAQLKEQINKCCLDAINRGTANTVKAVKEFGMPERIEELVKQNAILKELLKDCRLAIFDYPPYDLASDKIRLTNKIDEALK